MEPYTYLLKQSGKGFCENLSIAFNYWCKIKSDKMSLINEVVEMVHNSTLLYVLIIL